MALPGVTYASDRDYPQAQVATVSEPFFDVMRMPARQGRLFTPADSADALPVAVVSENFVRTHYPDGALGRQVRVVEGEAVVWRTIVGLVQDMRELDFGASVTAAVYVPLAQAPTWFLTVLAHTEGDPLAQTAAVRRVVASLDRNLPIYNVTTLQETMDRNAWAWRVFGTLFTTFGLAALFMATVGLYGVMAFSVSRRTPEIGVRIAMGAEPRDVMGMVLRQGAVQVGLGVALGAGLAVLLSRAMQLMFFQVGAGDPRYFLVVAGLLLADRTRGGHRARSPRRPRGPDGGASGIGAGFVTVVTGSVTVTTCHDSVTVTDPVTNPAPRAPVRFPHEEVPGGLPDGAPAARRARGRDALLRVGIHPSSRDDRDGRGLRRQPPRRGDGHRSRAAEHAPVRSAGER